MASTVRGSDNFDSAVAGSVIQVQNYKSGAVATGTALIPRDDTVPQITEGTEFMSLAFTPKKANSKIKIDVTIGEATLNSSGNAATFAIFSSDNTNALSCAMFYSTNAGTPASVSFSAFVDATSTAMRTYSVRGGATAAATLTFNGNSGTRVYGGATNSSITITEIAQ